MTLLADNVTNLMSKKYCLTLQYNVRSSVYRQKEKRKQT